MKKFLRWVVAGFRFVPDKWLSGDKVGASGEKGPLSGDNGRPSGDKLFPTINRWILLQVAMEIT